PASKGDSRPHFTQRIQRGNGRTGTPILASADQTSTSSLFWKGGIRIFSTCAPRTFRTAERSRASRIGWQRSFSQRSIPSVTTDRLGRSISAPGPYVHSNWLGRTSPTGVLLVMLMLNPHPSLQDAASTRDRP